MDVSEHLLDIDDTKCILVEFSNENGNVAVGYLNWLMNSDESDIENIMKNSKDVIIRWPKECLIDGAVSKMKRRLRNCKWVMHVVKIIGFGDWMSMCAQLSSYVKYDVPNPTKKDRKLLAKKKWSDDEEDECNSQKKRAKQIKKESLKLKTDAKRKACMDIISKLRDKNSEIQTTKKTDSAEDSSDEEIIITSNESNKKWKKIFEKEKEENRRLRDIIYTYEAVESLEKKIKKITESITRLEEIVKETVEATVKVLLVNKHDPSKDDDDILVLPLDDSTIMNVQSVESDMPVESYERVMPVVNETEKIAHSPIKESTTETIKLINNDIVKTNDGRYFGNRLITKSQLSKLNDSSLSKMTCDLLTIVFDKQELRESSLTGKQSHINKNKSSVEIKQLDIARLADVEDYVYKKFGKSIDNTKLFRIAVRNKCNNAKKVTTPSS